VPIVCVPDVPPQLGMRIGIRIARPDRRILDLEHIVHDLKSRCLPSGAEPLVDTSAAARRCFLGMQGVFAELETNL